MKTVIRAVSALISSVILASSLSSCEIVVDKSIAYSTNPPVLVTADGTQIPINCTKRYDVDLSEINSQYAYQLCNARNMVVSNESINTIWLGENIFGVGLASIVYFGKFAKNLTNSEWDFLCNIARYPTNYEYVISEGKKPQNSFFDVNAPYAQRIPESAYLDAVIEQVVSDLVEQKGYTRTDAFDFVYSEGITIKSPYSESVQKAVDEVYADKSNFTSSDDGLFPQSACVIMDYNGGILAVSGGNDDDDIYNRAYRSLHKIGSSIKPISVYTPALEEGIINFSSLVPDTPFELPDNQTLKNWPSNYNNVYEENVTVTYALRQSKNTSPVHLASRLGEENCYSFMKNKLGFKSLDEEDKILSAIALGYLTRGAKLTELAGAYQIFGNGGVYNRPHFYNEVLDRNGNVILSTYSDNENVIDSQNAWIMNRLLKYNVSMPYGIADHARLNGVEVIGKTGTVDNIKGEDTEKVFAGATPNYVGAVWVGFDYGDVPISNYEYESPTDIWRKVMEHLPQPKTEFTPDSNVIALDYCTYCGGISGEMTYKAETGYYRADNTPAPCTCSEFHDEYSAGDTSDFNTEPTTEQAETQTEEVIENNEISEYYDDSEQYYDDSYYYEEPYYEDEYYYDDGSEYYYYDEYYY